MFLNELNKGNASFLSIVVNCLIVVVGMLIEKLSKYINVFLEKGKYNDSYFVLNTYYNFEDLLEKEIGSDPNISSEELQTPKEE